MGHCWMSATLQCNTSHRRKHSSQCHTELWHHIPVNKTTKTQFQDKIFSLHIVKKFLSIRQRIHSKRLRILNTLWSDFWIGVTFTSQTSSSLPHLCDNKKFPDSILERHSSLLLFSYSRVKTQKLKNWSQASYIPFQWKSLLFLLCSRSINTSYFCCFKTSLAQLRK